MNLTKKHLIITGLTILILLSLFFIIGETSFKITPNQITQYIPPAETQTAAVADFDSNLIAHYTFDDGTASDTTGSNNGALIGGPTATTGKVGSGALSFDGVDDYVSLGTTNIPTTGAVSISTWVKIGPSPSGTDIILSRYSSWNLEPNRGYFRLLLSGGNNPVFYGLCSNGGGGICIADSATTLTPGNWYHIVATTDGLTGSSLKIYINGVLKASGIFYISYHAPSSSNFRLGISNYDTSNPLNGSLDDVRIYNRALSSSEITELYNSPSVDTGTTTTNTNPPVNTSPSVDTGTGSNATPTPSPTQTNTNPLPIPIQTNSAIIPADRMISWNPGISGGIPTFPKSGGKIINVKLNYGASGDGVTDDTSAIQNAINAANPGDVVYLPSGLYVLTGSALYTNKTIVIRGDGMQSRLKIHGAGGGLRMGSRWTSFGSAIPLTGSYTKGATQIVLAQAGSFSPGQYVVIDELNPPYVDTTGGSYLCEDRSGSITVSTAQRCITQIAQIVNVNGSTLTLNRPLYTNYDAVLNPRVYKVNMVENVGLEDLYIERVDNVGDGNIIGLYECAHCWVRNVETHFGQGDHYNINYTYASEIIDNFLYMGHNDYGNDAGFESFGVDGGKSYGVNFRGFGYGSGRNYGIHLAYGPNTDNLIQNNIIDSTRHGVIFEGPGAGNVIAYNYVLNGVDYNGLDWNTEALSNHGVHPYMNLWEGNIADNVNFDFTHGSGSWNTIFRNRLTSGPTWKTGGVSAIDLQQRQWNVNIVGNVLGNPLRTNYIYDAGSTNSRAIYRFGHASAGGLFTDPNVVATLLRWGNFDYINNSIQWNITERPDGINASHNIPPSLYLSSKPSWFGSLSWPPFGPDPNSPTTLLNGTIPAEQCFHNNNLANGGTFDPSTCYGGSSSIHPPAPPSGGTPPSTSTPGDFDHDGSVNVLDFSAMKVYWNHSDTLSAQYDLNKDGTVNTLDYVIMVQNWTG